MNINDLLKKKSMPTNQPQSTATVTVAATSPAAKSILNYKMTAPTAGKRTAPVQPAINSPAEPESAIDDPFAAINSAFESAVAETGSSLIDTANVVNYHYSQQAESCDDPHAAQFFTLMHELVNNFPRQEINKQMVTIMQHLADHPQLKAILKPEDIGHMVKALRESYGVAFTNKQQAKAKTSERKRKDNEVLDELAGLGF